MSEANRNSGPDQRWSGILPAGLPEAMQLAAAPGILRRSDRRLLGDRCCARQLPHSQPLLISARRSSGRPMLPPPPASAPLPPRCLTAALLRDRPQALLLTLRRAAPGKARPRGASVAFRAHFACSGSTRRRSRSKALSDRKFEQLSDIDRSRRAMQSSPA